VLADAKGLTLRSAIAPEMPTQIYADRYWLRQILTNLLGNSIKFTDEGDVDVKIYPSGADKWVIQVTDTGIGIPESAQEKIFEPFWQLSSSKQKLGSGLGLSIVKQLTTMMGGNVQLHSSEGKGTTFVVTLPLEPVPEFVG
jgi:signal transduction histidine kinase